MDHHRIIDGVLLFLNYRQFFLKTVYVNYLNNQAHNGSLILKKTNKRIILNVIIILHSTALNSSTPARRNSKQKDLKQHILQHDQF